MKTGIKTSKERRKIARLHWQYAREIHGSAKTRDARIKESHLDIASGDYMPTMCSGK
jgi:hypothetical protein